MIWFLLLALLGPIRRPSCPAIGKDRLREERAVILAHGARSLLVTGLIAIMALVSIAAAPPADLPWYRIPVLYAALAAIAFHRSRSTASGGIVPIGTHGDARLVLAVVATAGMIGLPAWWPAMTAAHPFMALDFAAALAGAADGAWLAMATRRLGLSPVQAFTAFLHAIPSGEACSWRIAAPGAGRKSL